MTKRIISVTLALIMLFGILIVPTASAAEPKILGTRTVQLGYTATVSLTDPNTGEKLDLIWESSNPSIATVTSDGKVTPHKVGTCVMTTLWNGKWYGIQVNVVSGSSSSNPSGKTSAYTKLTNYLEKNGTKTTAYGSTDYIINWKEDGYTLWSCYSANIGVNVAITIPKANSADIYTDYAEGVFLNLMKSGKRIVNYWKQSNSWTCYTKTYKKGTTVNTAKLKLKFKQGSKFSKSNSRARKLSKAGMSLWNKFLKARVGITVKKLGFIYKTGASAKKISLSKKSATLKKGKTLKLKLKNAKASKVKWSSSKKKIATVSKKGVVKAKKKGKATITAKYKGKKYKCKITVKKGGMTAAQAYNKLKKYIKKKGQKKTYSDQVKYSISWKINSFFYEIYYDEFKQGSSQIVFIGNSNGLEIILFIDPHKSNFDCSFYKYKNDYNPSYDMELSYPKKSFILEKIPDFQFYDNPDKATYNEANLNAKATLEWMFPEFNKFISKKAGVTMKNLGFKKWK